MVKTPPANAGSISGSGRSPGGGPGNPLQYSCLENPMDRGDWWAIVHRVTKMQTLLKQFNMHAHTDSKELREVTFSRIGSIKKWSLGFSDIFQGSVQFSSVAQSCPTLGDPMDCNPPVSSVHGIFQARILEWVAISFSHY